MNPEDIPSDRPQDFFLSLLTSLKYKDRELIKKHFRPDRPFFDLFIDKRTVHSVEELMEHQEPYLQSKTTSFSFKVSTIIREGNVAAATVEADVIRSETSHTKDILLVKIVYDGRWYVSEIFNMNLGEQNHH